MTTVVATIDPYSGPRIKFSVGNRHAIACLVVADQLVDTISTDSARPCGRLISDLSPTLHNLDYIINSLE